MRPTSYRRTTLCRLSGTAYSIFSQLTSASGGCLLRVSCRGVVTSTLRVLRFIRSSLVTYQSPDFTESEQVDSLPNELHKRRKNQLLVGRQTSNFAAIKHCWVRFCGFSESHNDPVTVHLSDKRPTPYSGYLGFNVGPETGSPEWGSFWDLSHFLQVNCRIRVTSGLGCVLNTIFALLGRYAA